MARRPAARWAPGVRIYDPRQYVVGDWPADVKRTAWALHCAYNCGYTSVNRLERLLVTLLRGLDVVPVWVDHECKYCGGALADLGANDIGEDGGR